MERVEGVRVERVGVEGWGVGWRGGDRVEWWVGGGRWMSGMEGVWG